MKYLLHRSALVDFLLGQPHLLARLRSTAPVDIAIAAPTIMEIQYAFVRHPDLSVKAEAAFSALVGAVNVLSFDRDDALEAGRMVAQAQATNLQLDALEAQLCAVARRRDLTLVIANRTSGPVQLKSIPDLRVLDWGLPAI